MSHVSSFEVRVAHTRGGGLLYYVVPVWYSRVAWAKAHAHLIVREPGYSIYGIGCGTGFHD